MSEKYLEDFAVGQVYRSGRLAADKERIKTFAAEFDPQPFHLDEEAARQSIFGGLPGTVVRITSLWGAPTTTVRITQGGPRPRTRVSTRLQTTANYDVGVDGRRFLMVKGAAGWRRLNAASMISRDSPCRRDNATAEAAKPPRPVSFAAHESGCPRSGN